MSHVSTAIGLMSGTSMDGIDAALLRTDGETLIEPGARLTVPYDQPVRDLIRRALADAAGVDAPHQRHGVMGEAETAITAAHGEAVEALLRTSGLAPDAVDVVGFHGQTVIHRPDRGFTVQLGDGTALARRLAIDVVAEMRAADMAAGGQGAPLAPVYHRALAARAGLEPPVGFINLGGVANITWVGPEDRLLAFDTGPASALLDDWCAQRAGCAMDMDGAFAARGTVDERALAALLDDSYFDQPPPKSLDRDHFSRAAVDALSLEDGAATLTAFSAAAVARAERFLDPPPRCWVVCGGGRRNPSLMGALAQRLAAPVSACDELAIDGDSVEAEAFAYMAVRSLRGLPLTFPGTTGVPAPQTGGTLYPAR